MIQAGEAVHLLVGLGSAPVVHCLARHVVLPRPGALAMEMAEPCSTEVVHVREDGPSFVARIQTFPVPGAAMGGGGFIEVVQDVSRVVAPRRSTASSRPGARPSATWRASAPWPGTSPATSTTS